MSTLAPNCPLRAPFTYTHQAEIWHATYWVAQQWENTRGEAPAKSRLFLDRSSETRLPAERGDSRSPVVECKCLLPENTALATGSVFDILARG